MKKILIVLVVFIAIVVGAFLYANHWYNSGLEKRMSTSSDQVKFTIESGESTDSIAKRLEEAGLIENEWIFKIYLRKENKGVTIQAGDFLIPQKATIPEIVEILARGYDLDVVRVTIIEGYRLSQIQDTLEKAFEGREGVVFDGTEFDSIVQNPDSYDFNAEVEVFLATYKPTGKSLEGFLYPDTYEFENTASTKIVIQTMIAHFMDKTSSLEKGDDFYDKLILASIVERESLTDAERATIASVLTNRLEIGMALQSDATVNYATGKSDPRPTYADLEVDSPYNTYKYAGLPPTPICSPRLESIEAALNPADTNYYYFIHEQDGSGQVHFAETLEEHNANISKYLN